MVKLVRRFEGNPFRLVSRTYNFTKDGKPRHPIESKSIAERQAMLLRKKGYNARVVSWRGGSGVYASPKKYNVTYTDTVNIKINEGGLLSALKGFPNDYDSSKREAQNLKLQNGEYQFGNSTDDQNYFFLGQALPGVAKNNEKRLEKMYDPEMDDTILPQSSFEKRKKSLAEELHPVNAVAMNMAHLDNINIRGQGESGIPGFGGKLSDDNMPEITRPARFWVVINWNKKEYQRSYQSDGGQQPTYAFGTLAEAKEFRKKLGDRIEEIGYYYDNKGGAIHSEEIDLEIKKVNRAPNMQDSTDDLTLISMRPRGKVRGGKR